MIKTDDQGNLYVLSDNSGYFRLKDLPPVSGKLEVVFNGDVDVVKEFDVNRQGEALVKLSKKDIEDIGVGVHRWYADLTYGDEKDTIIYSTITVIEKDM